MQMLSYKIFEYLSRLINWNSLDIQKCLNTVCQILFVETPLANLSQLFIRYDAELLEYKLLLTTFNVYNKCVRKQMFMSLGKISKMLGIKWIILQNFIRIIYAYKRAVQKLCTPENMSLDSSLVGVVVYLSVKLPQT